MAKMRQLTDRQEKFCQNIVAGMNYTEAYLAAYQNNSSLQVARNEGSKLMMKEHIQKRVAELQRPIVEAVQVNVVSETQKIKELLWERIEICRQTGDEAAIARYTDQLNKLNAAYKDTKPLDDAANDVGNLDTDSLLKLVNS